MNNIIYPPYNMVYKKDKPYPNKFKTIFLAGPIQDSYDWQTGAINILNKDLDEDFYIACPKRYEISNNFNYNEQVDWESIYMKTSAINGVLMFYLCNQFSVNETRSYAQTSRYELGEWITRKTYQPNLNIVVGIDNNFSGSKYIIKKIKDETNIPILYTLEETCKEVIKIINYNK